MNIVLRQLTALDEESFFEGLKAWDGHDPVWHTFSWKPGMTFHEMLLILEKEVKGIDLPPDRVPHTMLYGFLGSQIVGRVSVRHQLNEALRRRNGNLGYAVAPAFRRKGYASEMLKQSLDYCQKIGLKEILLTCADNNEASWKIIEKFGGLLDKKFTDENTKELVRKYWIKLEAPPESN